MTKPLLPTRKTLRSCGCFLLVCFPLFLLSYLAYVTRWVPWLDKAKIYELQSIAAAIEAGTLKPGKDRDVLLPPRWAHATTNGHAYVGHEHGRIALIFFPARIDTFTVDWSTAVPPQPMERRFMMAGYVYSPERLRDGWAVNVDWEKIDAVYP